VVTGMDLYYGFNNWDKEKVFNSLVASLKMPGSASLDLATGVRLVRDDAAGAAESAVSVPMSSGEDKVSLTVDVTYEMK
jgi:uncharacterized protein YggE